VLFYFSCVDINWCSSLKSPTTIPSNCNFRFEYLLLIRTDNRSISDESNIYVAFTCPMLMNVEQLAIIIGLYTLLDCMDLISKLSLILDCCEWFWSALWCISVIAFSNKLVSVDVDTSYKLVNEIFSSICYFWLLFLRSQIIMHENRSSRNTMKEALSFKDMRKSNWCAWYLIAVWHM
jgi:hypothetical protein